MLCAAGSASTAHATTPIVPDGLVNARWLKQAAIDARLAVRAPKPAEMKRLKSEIEVRFVPVLPPLEATKHIDPVLYPPVHLTGTQSLEPLAPGATLVTCGAIAPALARASAIDAEVAALAAHLEILVGKILDEGDASVIDEIDAIAQRLDALAIELGSLGIERFYEKDRKVVLTFHPRSRITATNVWPFVLAGYFRSVDYAAERWDEWTSASGLEVRVPSLTELTDFRPSADKPILFGVSPVRIGFAMSPATYCAPTPKPVRAVLDITERGMPRAKRTSDGRFTFVPLPQDVPEARSIYVLDGDASAAGAEPAATPTPAPTPDPEPCLDELDPGCSARRPRAQ
jgi:hypothetical protein